MAYSKCYRRHYSRRSRCRRRQHYRHSRPCHRSGRRRRCRHRHKPKLRPYLRWRCPLEIQHLRKW